MTIADKAEKISGASQNAGHDNNTRPPPHAPQAQDLTPRNAGLQRRLIRRKVFSPAEPGHNQRIIEHPFTGN